MMGELGINRERAIDILNENIKTGNLKKHCLATEVIMRRLAEHLGEDEEKWALAGLLHDLDFDETKDKPERHTLVTESTLREEGVSQEIIDAIKGHNAEALGHERTDKFEIALTCSETVTGMIVATALVYPDKKIRSVRTDSIMKRMKKKDFARNVSRERIRECERIGISLEDFIAISLKAMAEIDRELGL